MTDSLTGVLGAELDVLRGLQGKLTGAPLIVVGAYQGKTMAVLRDLYGPDVRICGFEPQQWAFDRARERLGHDPSGYDLHNYGLGDADRRAIMGEYGTDACSFLPLPGQREHGPGELRDVRKVWADLRLADVDLLLMNIEGYEHVLIPVMDEAGILLLCRYVLIQLHTGYVPPDQERTTVACLNRWHICTWSSEGNWFAYERKERY